MIQIQNVIFKGRKVDVTIDGKRFGAITPAGENRLPGGIDAEGKAIVPALYNTHTHAAMNLLRGYADDMPLDKWLNEYIWPFEEKLTPQDIRRGSRLAISEMTEGGTVFFNDMYFNIEETIDEVDKAGIRAAIGITVMDAHSLAQTEEKRHFIKEFKDPTGGRIQLVMAPHAIYTVGEERLRDCARFARENGMRLHIHLSETKSEVDGCLKQRGQTPVEYLDAIGFLGPDVIAAHCVWLTEKDADILAERGVTISHCPCSNMKLGSGRFPYETVRKAGCRVTLGTDGASSNNNLDLREEMKFAALLAKLGPDGLGNPTELPAKEVFNWATVNGAQAFGIDAGKIETGKLADFMLIDLNNPKMQPCFNFVSNFVYSADSSCISSVWCDGREIFNK